MEGSRWDTSHPHNSYRGRNAACLQHKLSSAAVFRSASVSSLRNGCTLAAAAARRCILAPHGGCRMEANSKRATLRFLRDSPLTYLVQSSLGREDRDLVVVVRVPRHGAVPCCGKVVCSRRLLGSLQQNAAPDSRLKAPNQRVQPTRRGPPFSCASLLCR